MKKQLQKNNKSYILEKDIKNLVSKCQHNDEYAYNKVIELNKPLIYSICKKYMEYGNKDDLISAGFYGLIKAVKKFNTKTDIKFSSFAYPYIKGEILNSLNADSMISISPKQKQFVLKIQKFVSDYSLKHEGKIPSSEIIKKELNLKETYKKIDDAKFTKLNVQNLDENIGIDNSSQYKPFQYKNAEWLPEEIQTEEDLINFINKAKLDEREKIIVLSKYGINDKKIRIKTIELSKQLNISQNRVMQLYKRGIIKLKKCIKK